MKASINIRNKLKIGLNPHKEYFRAQWLYDPIALIGYSLIFNIVITALYSIYTRKLHYANGVPIMCIITNIFILIEKIHIRFFNNYQPKFARSKWVRVYVYNFFKVAFWVWLLVMCISTADELSEGNGANPLDLVESDLNYLDISDYNVNCYIVVALISLLLNCAVLSVWWSSKLKSFYLLFAGINIVQILISVSLIQINVGLLNTSHNKRAKKYHDLFIMCAAFMIGQSMLGLGLLLIINDKNRLHQIIGKFIFSYDVLLLLLGMFYLACTAVAGVAYGSISTGEIAELPLTIPILFFLSFLIIIIKFGCTRYFRRRAAPNKLQVVEYDLCQLNKHQKRGWAKLIDLNKKYNSGVSGDHVISLMENYVHAKLPGMKCKVLRVYNKSVKAEHNYESEKENTTKSEAKNQGDVEIALQKNISKNDKVDVHVKEKSIVQTPYDELDQETVLFQNAPTLLSSELSIQSLEEEYKPLSKNQLKKLAKKNKKAKKDMELQALENNTEEFYQELMTTQALVLLTIIEEFDLSERIPGSIGKMLHKLFGKNSKWPLLCIKFGLLGFHWPFKRSTFYCSSTKKPVARSASVLSAISYWNKQNEKCSVMLDPGYKDASFEAGVDASGWIKINLPNSHIVDLRPHHNQNSTEFFKAIKYRNQDNAFKQASGVVDESYNFNFENCQEIIVMNDHIARLRQESGQSSQLLHPDWEFIYNLGNYTNDQKYRSLLFLKVDDEIIASCVIFRLGETMTSDIQGLDHDISKKYKAYFVMMQEVIKIGMRENVSFIDFGPTTEDAKVAIGCSVVPLIGSLYPRYKMMGPIIRFAASKVDV